jgi:hypothetical protein
MVKHMVSMVRFLSFCAVLLVLPVIAAAQGSVTLQPNQGTVRTGVTATGTGWPAGAVVHAFFNQQEVSKAPAVVGSEEGFTLDFCVPDNLSPGPYPTYFTIGQAGLSSGPIFTVTPGTPGNCQATAQCPDAYFIGAHGIAEDENSSVIVETWQKFKELADKAGKKNIVYYSLKYAAPLEFFDVEKDIILLNARDSGVEELDRYVRGTVLDTTLRKACGDPKIVLTGYSLGAWVINEWLAKDLDKPNGNWTLWPLIRAVELYGDPLWYRAGHDYQNNHFIYNGLATLISDIPNPYDNTLAGPASTILSLANRWQSRCLKGDPVCGEGYPIVIDPIGLLHHPDQGPDALACANPNTVCEHTKYIKAKGGYNLTERGANFLAFKAFPPVTSHPEVVRSETFREGVLVFFRAYYTDPLNAVNGFGFVGVNGSGWGEETHPFSSPSYGRVYPGRIEYPFNHACSTASEFKSDVEAWVVVLSPDGRIIDGSPGVDIPMACNAPCEVVTPFFQNAPHSSFTWDDVSSSRQSCSAGIAR